FTGNFGVLGLAPAVNVLSSGASVPLVLTTSAGGTAPTPTQITVITMPPAAPPAPDLEANSDTGGSSTDDITQNNNSSQFPAPAFDVSNSSIGATVQLFRTPVVNGTPGTPVLVNTLSGQAVGTVAIADINQSNPTLQTPGPAIPDGIYLYTAQLTDLAGN